MIALICLCNNKKGASWYSIITRAKGKIANQIFDIYRKGDFIIVEGSVKIKLHKIYIDNKYIKNIKSVNIKINRVHPTSFIFK